MPHFQTANFKMLNTVTSVSSNKITKQYFTRHNFQFGPLIRKQLAIYCKIIITRGLQIDLKFIMILFFRDLNRYYVTTMMSHLFSFKSNASLSRIFSGNALGYVDFGCSPSTVRSFTKINKE